MRFMPSTVLIADDHDDNRELMQILLSAAGYAVHEARNGSECLVSHDALQQRRPAGNRRQPDCNPKQVEEQSPR